MRDSLESVTYDGAFPDPETIGSIHKFGAHGPAYKVLEAVGARDGSWMVKIHVLESGEETIYPLAKVLQDALAD